jgi:hypothetical protein
MIKKYSELDEECEKMSNKELVFWIIANLVAYIIISKLQ